MPTAILAHACQLLFAAWKLHSSDTDLPTAMLLQAGTLIMWR
jgi:hypothetical protein